MNIVGFDFGTTNSLISVIRGGKSINFLDEEQRPIPSMVCYEGAQKILGREAKERLAKAGLGVQGNIVRSPKMYLGRDSVFVEGIERSPIDIVADVVRHVLQQAQSRDLGNIVGAVVTIPVDMEGYRRRALRDAFRLAGLSIVQFVHEPLAALYGLFRSQNLPAMLRRYDNKLVLVFDWGGGTLDLTLCRPMGDQVIQLMNDGTDEVGGDVFDEGIMNRLLQNVTKARGLSDNVDVHPGSRARLMDRCERAKIDLSSRSNVSVYVPSFFRGIDEAEFDYALSQSELEKIVGPMLDKGFKRIERILENAGYAPEQVALCVGTGGMSNMPSVKRRLHEWFGPERVQIPDGTATLIAEGAAWIAADAVGLQLAKNVELVLAQNSYLPLVKAGTAMPKETEVQSETFHLYCTDPRDGVAKFQICAPKRVGPSVLPSEPRTHLENVTVKVDAKAQAFQERLELDVRINDDLILEVHARSLNLKDDDRREIHNLEFGLRFPADTQATDSYEDPQKAEKFVGARPSTQIKRQTVFSTLGALSVRANVADRKDPLLVPGEFLYEYDPEYFDVRRNPPEHQVREKLYYQPCSLCGRASNDSACRCSTLLPGGNMALLQKIRSVVHYGVFQGRSSMSDFKWRHFRGEIILSCVRWYCKYGISYRDLEEMMLERGLEVDHTTLYRWVQHYAPEMEERLRWYWKPSMGYSWRVDETYVKVKGEWTYLYRAVDKQGDTIDFYLSPTRNTQAAKRFLGKALNSMKSWAHPSAINTDKASPYSAAITELKAEGKCPPDTVHRQVKYLNNIIEADHGKLKRLINPVRGFKSMKTAYATLKGFELMRMFKKGQLDMWKYGQGLTGEIRLIERQFGIYSA